MDKPLCRLCGSRHWSHEDHRFPENAEVEVGPIVTSPALTERVRKAVAEIEGKSPIMAADQTPLNVAEPVPYARVPVPKKSAVREKPARTHDDAGYRIDWSQCPHCAERRSREAARIKRWRESRRK